MAAAKTYSVEQIVAKLREHEKLHGQGLTIPQPDVNVAFNPQLSTTVSPAFAKAIGSLFVQCAKRRA
jgi:hypothetical protein